MHLLAFLVRLTAPLRWLTLSLVQYYLLYLLTVVAWRAIRLLWCGRPSARLPVSAKDAIFVTGATSGIGLCLARHFFKLGYSVIIGYYDDKEPGYAELKLLAEKKQTQDNNKILFVPINVRELKSIEKAAALIEELLVQNKLQLYALVNNAGLGSFTPFAMCNKLELAAILETNIFGTLMTTRCLMPLLVERARPAFRGSPRVLNVASGLGLFPGPTYLAYGVTKAAQIFFTRLLNCELDGQYGEHCVRTITLLPHNFIKYTNIGANFLQKHQNLWDEVLSKREKSLYKRDFEIHKRRLENLCDACEEFQRTSKQVPNKAKKSLSFRENLAHLLEVLKGKNEARQLGEADFLEAFELALRMERPPEELFAGDKAFNLFTGPLMLTLPSSLLRLFGKLVNESLYK